MCAFVTRSLVPPAGGNLWTVSEPPSCATRTASAARVTGSCASACRAETRSAAPCWPPRSARGRWRCCRTRRSTTAAAREAWRRSCSACRTTGASTWAWLRVSLPCRALSRANEASCCRRWSTAACWCFYVRSSLHTLRSSVGLEGRQKVDKVLLSEHLQTAGKDVRECRGAA